LLIPQIVVYKRLIPARLWFNHKEQQKNNTEREFRGVRRQESESRRKEEKTIIRISWPLTPISWLLQTIYLGKTLQTIHTLLSLSTDQDSKILDSNGLTPYDDHPVTFFNKNAPRRDTISDC
jgi:hypothetical protein